MIQTIMIMEELSEILQAGPYPLNNGGGHIGIVTTPSNVDCSEFSNLTLEFNSYYRRFRE